jgi:hypothetical protein
MAQIETLKKPAQIRIRISDQDAETLDKLAGQILTRTDVASVLLHSALEAVRDDKGKMHFPFKIEIAQKLGEKR